MRKLLTIVVLLLFQNNFSQDLVESINNYNSKIIDNNKYKMIIISDSNCGYCNITYKKLKHLTENLQVIIIDYSKTKDIREKYSEYNFISSTNLNGIEKKQDFFPLLYLYNKKNKLIWKKKGWFKRNIAKIEQKIKHY